MRPSEKETINQELCCWRKTGMEYKYLLRHTEGRIAWITLNRPEN